MTTPDPSDTTNSATTQAPAQSADKNFGRETVSTDKMLRGLASVTIDACVSVVDARLSSLSRTNLLSPIVRHELTLVADHIRALKSHL